MPPTTTPPRRRGRQTCATRMSRKRNDSFGRMDSTAGRRGSRGVRASGRFQGPPGRQAADRTRDRACFCDPFPGPESHARPRTQPGALPGGGGAGAPGPRLRAAATLLTRPPRPPPYLPGLPAAAAATYLSARAGRGPRLRWRRGGAGKTSLGPSAPQRLRLEARRGRNKQIGRAHV